jgi:16S rRNA (uracil1498-N3)-methyltransferase
MEAIIQKAAELRAHALVPLLTERVERDRQEEPAKAAKRFWVAVEAMKQCGWPWLPDLPAPRSIAQQLAEADDRTLSLLADLQSNAHPRDVFRSFRKEHGRLPDQVHLWIGPEGDFTAEERSQILDAGAHSISLGPSVLRADTAAVCALAVAHHELTSGVD